MDSKSESEEMTYPFVCFTVDNFDEAFSDIQVGLLSKSNFDVFFQVRDGEMVAVELVARDTRGSMEAVLSLGCIQYDSTRSLVFLKLYFDDWLVETLVVCYLPAATIFPMSQHDDTCTEGLVLSYVYCGPS